MAAKPTPKQVLETILIRTPPVILGPSEKDRGSETSKSAGDLGIEFLKPSARAADPSQISRPENRDESDELPRIDGFSIGDRKGKREWNVLPIYQCGDGPAKKRKAPEWETVIDATRMKDTDYDGNLDLLGDAASRPEALFRQLRDGESRREQMRRQLLMPISITDSGTSILFDFTRARDGSIDRRRIADASEMLSITDTALLEEMIRSLPPLSDTALLSRRPGYSGNDRLFHDLVSYAPGMNTSLADVFAVLEAETTFARNDKPGRIDDPARKLFDKARNIGWRTFTLPVAEGEAAFSITFDGAGRYAYERTIFPGLREQVVCDGDTLRHLYPDLQIGARRTVSRYHRLGFAQLVPLAIPRPDDLARGADLIAVGERTVPLAGRQGLYVSSRRLASGLASGGGARPAGPANGVPGTDARRGVSRPSRDGVPSTKRERVSDPSEPL